MTYNPWTNHHHGSSSCCRCRSRSSSCSCRHHQWNVCCRWWSCCWHCSRCTTWSCPLSLSLSLYSLFSTTLENKKVRMCMCGKAKNTPPQTKNKSVLYRFLFFGLWKSFLNGLISLYGINTVRTDGGLWYVNMIDDWCKKENEWRTKKWKDPPLLRYSFLMESAQQLSPSPSLCTVHAR